MTQEKNTKASRNSARDSGRNLNEARKIIDVQVSKADEEMAAHLLALYHDKRTPPLISSAIFALFLNSCEHFGVTLPNNFTSKWRGYWPLLIARHRREESRVTSIRYTWQPEPEEEAELDEQDRIEQEADALFDVMHNEHLPERELTAIQDNLSGIVDSVRVNIFSVRSLWREAWQIVLERLEDQEGEYLEEGSEEAESSPDEVKHLAAVN